MADSRLRRRAEEEEQMRRTELQLRQEAHRLRRAREVAYRACRAAARVAQQEASARATAEAQEAVASPKGYHGPNQTNCKGKGKTFLTDLDALVGSPAQPPQTGSKRQASTIKRRGVGFRRAGKDAREWAEKRQKALERAVELKEERLLLESPVPSTFVPSGILGPMTQASSPVRKARAIRHKIKVLREQLRHAEERDAEQERRHHLALSSPPPYHKAGASKRLPPTLLLPLSRQMKFGQEYSTGSRKENFKRSVSRSSSPDGGKVWGSRLRRQSWSRSRRRSRSRSTRSVSSSSKDNSCRSRSNSGGWTRSISKSRSRSKSCSRSRSESPRSMSPDALARSPKKTARAPNETEVPDLPLSSKFPQRPRTARAALHHVHVASKKARAPNSARMRPRPPTRVGLSERKPPSCRPPFATKPESSSAAQLQGSQVSRAALQHPSGMSPRIQQIQRKERAKRYRSKKRSSVGKPTVPGQYPRPPNRPNSDRRKFLSRGRKRKKHVKPTESVPCLQVSAMPSHGSSDGASLNCSPVPFAVTDTKNELKCAGDSTSAVDSPSVPEWACSGCGFDNDMSSSTCMLCGAHQLVVTCEFDQAPPVLVTAVIDSEVGKQKYDDTNDIKATHARTHPSSASEIGPSGLTSGESGEISPPELKTEQQLRQEEQELLRQELLLESSWELEQEEGAACQIQRVWRGGVGRSAAVKLRTKRRFAMEQLKAEPKERESGNEVENGSELAYSDFEDDL